MFPAVRHAVGLRAASAIVALTAALWLWFAPGCSSAHVDDVCGGVGRVVACRCAAGVATTRCARDGFEACGCAAACEPPSEPSACRCPDGASGVTVCRAGSGGMRCNCDSPPVPCEAGRAFACACASGARGSQICDRSGILEACVCESEDAGQRPDASGDACVPQTCADMGLSCGDFVDRCGGTQDCGFCLSSHRTIPVVGVDLEWDRTRSLLYVTTGLPEPLGHHSVVGLDPSTGEAAFSLYVGDGPARMALSDDASLLYVVLMGRHAIRRVDLASRTTGLAYPLGTAPDGTDLDAADLGVLPGQPSALAVSIAEQYGSNVRVAVLDDGIARPETAALMAYESRLAIADAATVLLRSQTSTTDQLRRLAIDERGVHEVAMRSGLVGGSDELVCSGRLVLSTTGEAVDSADLRDVGRYPVPGPIVSDVEANRTYVVGPASGEVRAVYAFDRSTFAELGRVEVPALATGTAYSLVRWGTHGLAYLEMIDRAAGRPASGHRLVAITSDLIEAAP